jgi:hypothetical protein
MDAHLLVGSLDIHVIAFSAMPQKLAPKYFSTLFIRVFVENVPWLVERLGIKVLPCVIAFVDGVSKERYGLLYFPNSIN